MANRYWVGGTAAWDGTAGTKWALTSGGAGGQAIPTSADDVFFDGSSGASTVTISAGNTGAKSITCTGFTGAIGGSTAITVSGNITLVAGMTFTYSGTVTFDSTATLITGGKSFVGGGINVNTTGTVTLGSAINCTIITVTQGTFDTNNFSVTVSTSGLSISGANSKTINLGSSTVSCTSNTTIDFSSNSSSLTFNAGTSQINSTAGSASGISFNAGTSPITFYNVSFTGVSYNSRTLTGTNVVYNNLTLVRNSAGSVQPFYIFSGTHTINGSLSVAAATARNQNIVITGPNFNAGSAAPSTASISAASATLNDASFYGINFSGAASPLTGTNIGDAGFNSGITFTAAKTVYWNLAGANNYTANGWATSSGGTPSDVFPLPQDTMVIDNSSALTSLTFQAGGAGYNIFLPGYDSSARTTSASVTFGGSPTACIAVNNINSGSGINPTGALLIGKNINFSTSGNPFSATLTCSNGLINLTSNSFCGSLSKANFAPASGFTLNSYSLTCSSVGNIQTLDFGTGVINVTGTGTVWNVTGSSPTASGSKIVNVTNSTATATTITATSSTESNAINFNFTAGTYTLSLLSTGTQAVGNIDFTGFSGTLSSFGASSTIYGNIKFSSTMTLTAGTNSLIFGATSGTKTITTSGKTLDFPININGSGGTFTLLDALTMGSTRTLTHTAGTLDLGGQTCTAASYATAAGTKNLTFNGGTLVCSTSGATAFNNANPTNYTTTTGSGVGKISMTSASAKTFVGGGSTYNCTLSNDGAGTLTITGSNTFTSIANGVQPTTFSFTAGTTTTVTNWNVSGTSGNLVTIQSATASSHTLSKSSGTVSSDYLSISRSTATGGATWYAGANSTNGGNNSGWIFTAPPYTPSGAFFTLMFN